MRELLGREIRIKTARAQDLDPIREVIDHHLGGRTIVVSVDDRVHEQLVARPPRVIAHGSVSALVERNRTGTLDLGRQLVEASHDAQQVARDAPLLEDIRGVRRAVVSDILHVGARQEIERILGDEQDPGVRGTTCPRIEEAQGGELLLRRAVVLLDRVASDGVLAIAQREEVQREIGQRCLAAGARVPCPGQRRPALGEDALVLLAGDGLARADADPDATSIADRRQIGGEDLHGRHVPSSEGPLLHGHDRERLDIAV
ncbi:hypothetical protein WME78_38420 [Sorangium sp. So ce1097]